MLTNPEKLPRWVVGLCVVGSVAAIAFTVQVVRFGMPFALFGVFAALAGMGTVVWSRARAARQRATSLAVEQPVVVVPAARPDASWVSSGTFPGWFGPMEATAPMVVLELYEHVLRLRMQPRFMAAIFGVAPLVVAP